MSGRPRGDNWAWLFFDVNVEEIVCTFVGDSGEKCGHKLAKHIGNGMAHLRSKHGLREDHPATVARLERHRGAQRKLGFTKARFSQVELEAMALSEGFRPFSMVEGKIFRQAFHPHLLTGKAAASVTSNLAIRLRDEVVYALGGGVVTVAFDSGTVWSRYLVIVVRSGVCCFVLGVVPDSALDGTLTAVNVGRLLSDTVSDLRRRNVHVIAVVADNGSNFQAEDAKVDGTAHLRCGCHVLQLCAKDLLAGDAACRAAEEAAEELQEANSWLPKPVVTRWNSNYYRWEVAVSPRGRLKLLTSAENLERVTAIERGVKILKPFAISTRFLEADSATIFDQINVIQILEECEVSDDRWQMLLTPAIVTIAFFSPCVNRSGIPQSLVAKIRLFLGSLRVFADGFHGPETLTSNIDNELNGFLMFPPIPVQGNVTMKSLKAFLKGIAGTVPRIASIVSALCDASPSEACVERVFSKLKFSLNKNRTSTSFEHAEAQIIVNSALSFQESAEPDVEEETVTVREGVFAFILKKGTPREQPEKQTGRRRATRGAETICAMCNEAFEKHANEASVSCDKCGRWYALHCVGIPVHLRAQLENMQTWKCHKCR